MTPDALSDRLAVSDLLDDYAYGVDTKDWELALSVFAPDATLDYSAFGGPNGSVAEVIEWISASVASFPMTQHHITNRRIRLDGDTATCSAELYAPMGMAAADGQMKMLLTGGRYVDTFRRTPDGWRISARRCENAWLGMGPDVTRP